LRISWLIVGIFGQSAARNAANSGDKKSAQFAQYPHAPEAGSGTIEGKIRGRKEIFGGAQRLKCESGCPGAGADLQHNHRSHKSHAAYFRSRQNRQKTV